MLSRCGKGSSCSHPGTNRLRRAQVPGEALGRTKLAGDFLFGAAVGGLASWMLWFSGMTILRWPGLAHTSTLAGVRSRAPLSAIRLLLLACVVAGITLVATLGLLDPFSVLITLGGGLAVARASHPGEAFGLTWRRIEAALGKGRAKASDPERLIRQFKDLARVHRVRGVQALELAAREIGDPGLKAAIENAFAANDGGLLDSWLQREQRRIDLEGETSHAVFSTLARLFPAFGLIGTLIGLAMLLDDIGRTDAAGLAAALGVSVLTTLYGAVLANVVVLPLATKVETDVAAEFARLELLACGAAQVRERAYPTAVERAMRRLAGIELVGDEEEGQRVVRLEEQAA